MNLKYQDLINNQELSSPCPPESSTINEEVSGARWVVAPIEHELNFLPNHLYNLKIGQPRRPMSDRVKCGNCSLSFHTSVEASKNAFYALSSVARQKLGYTHVAAGKIGAGWGLITEVHAISQHFELFEAENSKWHENFRISVEL